MVLWPHCSGVAADRVSVTFLTVTEFKAITLRRHFERMSAQRLSRLLRQVTGKPAPLIPMDARVVPGLINLLPHSVHTHQANRHA